MVVISTVLYSNTCEHRSWIIALFVFKSDLKGSLPTSVVNLVSSTQPMIVYHVKKALQRQFEDRTSDYMGKPVALQGDQQNQVD